MLRQVQFEYALIGASHPVLSERSLNNISLRTDAIHTKASVILVTFIKKKTCFCDRLQPNVTKTFGEIDYGKQRASLIIARVLPHVPPPKNLTVKFSL